MKRCRPPFSSGRRKKCLLLLPAVVAISTLRTELMIRLDFFGAMTERTLGYLLAENNVTESEKEDVHRARNNKEGSTKTTASSSPVASMLSSFPNRAIEREVRQHDRYIIDSLAFLNTIKGFKLGPTTVDPRTKAPFTIVALTRNRAVPYIAALISMLLRGHEPREFRRLLDIHVVNVERRDGRETYHLFDSVERKLSELMTFHRWTEESYNIYSEHHNITDDDPRMWLGGENQRLDYIRSLELCQSRQSRWCVVLQDDSLPVNNFAGNLQKYIDRQTYSVKQGEEWQADEIQLQTVGMIKLFSAHNCGRADDNERNLQRDEYAEKHYQRDIAEYANVTRFVHRTSTNLCGAVAEAFPSIALSAIISHLQKQDSNDTVQVDELLHQFSSNKTSGLQVLEMSPSMVNHIGFVSDNEYYDSTVPNHISTDVRFSLTRGIGQTANPRSGSSSRTFSSSGMLGHFGVNNDAITREVQKHDRYVVDNMVYWSRFNASQAARYAQNSTAGPKQLTLVVLTVNRYIPYLSVFLGALIRGHTTNDLAQLDLHVVNVERRQGKVKYSLFDDFRKKLASFVSFHDWTDQYEESATLTDSNKQYYANQRKDYIRALKLCQSKGTSYCLVFEDDAVPCAGFLKKFQRYVDLTEYRVFANPDDEDAKAEVVSRDQVGVMKLFNSWNDGHTSEGLSRRYAVEDYPRDQALDAYEAKAVGRRMEEIQHRISPSRRSYGLVGDAYHASVVQKLIDFLELHAKVYPVDSLINKRFIEESKLKRLVVNPSMINHIGHMSEHMNDFEINAQRIATDVRFQLDDQSYWKYMS